MIKLEFDKQRAKLANVNVRSEVKGEDREPAADLKVHIRAPNDILAHFHPSLKSLLYYFDDARPADLADAAQRATEGYAPHRRMPSLTGPLNWDDGMENATVAIGVPGAKTVLELVGCKVNSIQITPLDGGTVDLVLRVQAHPDEKQFGKLCQLVQTEVEFTLTADEAAA